MNTLIQSFSTTAVVYPAHRKHCKKFACNLAKVLDADTFKIREIEGKHISTECISFLHSYYELLSTSPAKPMIFGLGKIKKNYQKDIKRLQADFYSENIYLEIPIFNIKKSIIKYLSVIDEIHEYLVVPKNSNWIGKVEMKETTSVSNSEEINEEME
ncbi:Uncharacterized protein QTN25_002910 [Entamoeba marina]